MDWKDISGAVAKAAPILGLALGGPVGGAVGGLVSAALGVEAEPDKVHAALAADPQALVKLRELEKSHERELRAMVIQGESNRLAEVNATMRAEATSGDRFVSRWRPTFGYLMALTWAAQMFALAWTIVHDAAAAPHVISAMASLGTIWSVGLAVVGVSVWKRSADKAVLAGADPAAGFKAIGGLFGKGGQ